jgi:hypothetical protein
MDSFNKIISFVLGLVVVVVFLAVISGRLNLGSKKASPTPTPTPTPTVAGTSISKVTISQTPINNYQNPKTIPSTGPELLFPLVFSSFLSGLYLKKTGKNK